MGSLEGRAHLSISFLAYVSQVPEICRNVTESEVVKHAFDLIAAFDEIIALGYPENVNLSQIRTYTEMNSHEEAIYKMVKEVRGDTTKDWNGRSLKPSHLRPHPSFTE